MPELGIQNQCIFISVYASFILLCAKTITSQQTGSLGATVTTRYLCTSCGSQINEICQIYTGYIPDTYHSRMVYVWNMTNI
jgi:hypothetical protein